MRFQDLGSRFSAAALVPYILYEYPGSGKALPKVFRRTAFFLLEYPVEVGDIIKAAIIRYFRNRLGGIYQHAGCMPQPYFSKGVDKSISCTLFIKPAECGIGHICQPGYF